MDVDVQRSQLATLPDSRCFEDEGAYISVGPHGEVLHFKGSREEIRKRLDGVGDERGGLQKQRAPAKMPWDVRVEAGDDERAKPEVDCAGEAHKDTHDAYMYVYIVNTWFHRSTVQFR